MSLIFAAVTPHPPLLIPAIGKEHIDQIVNTKKALEMLEGELYVARPHVIIIISPHSSIFPDAFSVNAHSRFTASFDTFGDLATKRSWEGSPDLAADISHRAKAAHISLQQVGDERLDHGAAVPLFYLTSHLPDVHILPIGYSALSNEDHIRFGSMLKDVIMNQDKRVGVIASGDLSHCLTADSPAGYRPEGKIFDETLIRHLENQTIDQISTMGSAMVKEAEDCAFRSLLILSGILKDMKTTFQKYSYECPFGVGYLVGNFNL